MAKAESAHTIIAPALSLCASATIAAIGFEAILDRPAAEQFAARAETDAAMATGQIVAAVAILAKSKDQLVSLVAAAGQGEAARRKKRSGVRSLPPTRWPPSSEQHRCDS
jgi:hypothetical protein